jgi:hypothetical protein
MLQTDGVQCQISIEVECDRHLRRCYRAEIPVGRRRARGDKRQEHDRSGRFSPDPVLAQDGIRAKVTDPRTGNKKEVAKLLEGLTSTNVARTVARQSVNYICFAAGTPVQTSTGPKAIEDIEIGDLV